MPRIAAGMAAALLLAVAPAGGQEPVRPLPASPDSLAALDLPDRVAARVVELFNAPGSVRFNGATRVPVGDTIRADLAVLRGPLELAGHVEGRVVVVNGDVRLLPGASVAGDLWVVGGTVEGVDSARVEGEVVAYQEALPYRREGRRIARVTRAEARGEDPGSGREGGRSDFLVATGKSYNRVEGLPITFGPRIRTEGSNPLRLHALAIYRTEAGFTLDTEEMGYFVRAEQFLGGDRRLRVGATLHSLVDPIEDVHLSDLESGLSTFVFHRDFRDHFERRGLGGFLAWEPAGAPLSLTVEGVWERHRSRAAGNPWSVFNNTEPWRPQPLVGEGRLGSVGVRGAFDTRSSTSDPATGWLLQGRVEQALHVDLERPAAFAPAAGGAAALFPAQPFGRFTSALLDLRRYNRVDPRSRLNFRLLAGGSLTGVPLPPQRQHALGGEGTLPGYPLFGLDCAARSAVVHRGAAETRDPDAPSFFPRYGCDAFALFQAEYRGKLSFRMRWGAAPWRDEDDEDDDDWGMGWDLAPDWTVFVDAGRGWANGSDADQPVAVDVGAGLLVDRLGVFVALPLTGGDGLNLFVRLGPRF